MNIDMTHTTAELFAALAEAQAAVENATKNARNPHFGSRYADLGEVLNTIRPAFSAAGLAVIQSTGIDGGVVVVETVIAHAGGGYVMSSAACVPGKTDAQGVGAATTYLRRYALAAMCGISQEDDDGETTAGRPPPAPRRVPDRESTGGESVAAAIAAVKLAFHRSGRAVVDRLATEGLPTRGDDITPETAKAVLEVANAC